MGREHSSSRRSKSHSSKRKTCKVEHCNRERKSTRHNGETTTYKYCEKHWDRANSNNQGSGYATPPYARCCEQPLSTPVSPSEKCNFRDCNCAINPPSSFFCPRHERVTWWNSRLNYSRPFMRHSAPPSPPWSSSPEPADGTIPSEHPAASSTAASYTTDGRRNSTQSTTSGQSAPHPATTTVAAPAETTMESKVEAASYEADQGKHQMCDENDHLPTFWSGVSVDICILLQIIHVLMRLLLELAQGVGKRGMW
ncbi:hypothetical protein CFAM422_002565 [Trichoderma lentiforme]|uniref:Uncharacterized protein n=1 Tax=Trichoderma lentiforme TaxID=1567552 RepID=A0A9P5CHL1_9HYPO|nr:hypothetical protein CFAM422_002565 [Trichoderma lentiforme]